MNRRLVSGLPAGLAALSLGLGCAVLGLGKKEPVAARVGGEVITVPELDAWIKEDMWKHETADGNPSRLYEIRMAGASALVRQRALDAEAKKRGSASPEAMLDDEFKNLPPIEDAAVKQFYDQNTDKMAGKPLEEVTPQIITHLTEVARHKAFEAILAKYDPHIDLVRPRVELRPGGPARGPADARVTLVEFSDFQCPYCRQAEPVLQEITKRYPNDVRVVYRNLPIDSLHPRARASAEAAQCALEGNKFWEYHDKLFANSRALGDEDLRKYASEVGLDAATFDECVRSRRHAGVVDEDAQEAKRIGITGTPAFFVNGIMLSGLKTADDLDSVIRDELHPGS